MGQPLVTKDMIIEYLRIRAPQDPIIEVFPDYPNDDNQLKYGVYVRDVSTISREPYQLGVTYGGSIYTEVDSFQIVFISFQEDPQGPKMRIVIEDMAPDVRFFDGYFEVSFVKAIQIGNRSEKYTYTFNMKRIEFNNAN